MAVKIQLFGQLKQITGKSEIMLDVTDTEELMIKMTERYPELENMKCLIAVDKNIIQSKTPVSANQELALLPPYSGG